MLALRFILLIFCCESFAIAGMPREVWVKDAKEMSGEYTIVGKKPDSNVTYYGHISLRANGAKLAFARTISDVTVLGTAHFDTVADYDNIPVLRLRFSQDGKLYEGIYQWRLDYDHRMQFTGYVYLPDNTTKAAGLETFLPAPPPVSR